VKTHVFEAHKTFKGPVLIAGALITCGSRAPPEVIESEKICEMKDERKRDREGRV